MPRPSSPKTVPSLTTCMAAPRLGTMAQPGFHRLQIPRTMAGLRADRALASLIEGLSRSRAARLIEEGKATLDAERFKPSRKVEGGEWLEVEVPPEEELRLIPQPLPLEILYNDPFLLVVNKPAGMPVHPAAGWKAGTLMNALLAGFPEFEELLAAPESDSATLSADERLRPGVVHRLDRDTSGLLVVAKTEFDRKALSAQVKARTATRRYLALVWGEFKPPEGLIEAPIGRHPVDRKRMAVVESGREAATGYRTLLRLGPMSLVEARLVTGRTHQIRVHFSHLHHPVVGDPVYGGRQRRYLEDLPPELRQAIEGLSGQALHAYFLSFQHPRTGRQLSFSSPPRQDILNLLRAARGDRGQLPVSPVGHR